MSVCLQSLTPEILQDHLKEWGEPAYRGGQILDWIYRKRVGDIDEMSNLPKKAQREVESGFPKRFA